MNQAPQYDVFLSHNSADKPAVEEIAVRLREKENLEPFLDKWHLVPGEPWQEALEEAVAKSRTVAVFVGPSGVSPWHNEEMCAALTRAARTREFRVIPVLLPGSSEASVRSFLASRTWVDLRAGLDDQEGFDRLVAGIRGIAPGAGQLCERAETPLRTSHPEESLARKATLSTYTQTDPRSRFQETRDKLASILRELEMLAQERGGTIWSDQVEKAVKGTPFRVAVIGEFSRGKTTLINALLGKDVLATDFRPNTAVKTVVCYGPKERMRVIRSDESGHQIAIDYGDLQHLADLTSDAAVDDYRGLLRNDRASLAEQVQEVQVWSTSEFLKSREMELIDTPGLGSVFPAHKKVTYDTIPSVDAVLFLMQADPGPGENEIQFLRYVRKYVDQMLFVLSKADMVRSQDELEGMIEFVRTYVRKETDIEIENLYPVSARNALEGDLRKSGFDAFLPALDGFITRSSGMARLQSSLQLAQTHWTQLLRLVELDVQSLDQSLSVLLVELARLQGDVKRIRSRRDELLRYVDRDRLELLDDTNASLDDVHRLLQPEVEKAVDQLIVLDFRRLTDRLQIVMRETIADWLDRNERFNAWARRIRDHVGRELRIVLDSTGSGGSPGESEMEMDLDVSVPQVGRELWVSLNYLALHICSFLTTGFGAIFALVAPRRTRKWIKMRLADPIEGNTVNVYQAVIEGFELKGQAYPGVRAELEFQIEQWSQRLSKSVHDSFTRNLDSRLEQLERQIEEKASGQQDRAQDLTRYSLQKQRLGDLRQSLDQASASIAELSAGPTGTRSS